MLVDGTRPLGLTCEVHALVASVLALFPDRAAAVRAVAVPLAGSKTRGSLDSP